LFLLHLPAPSHTFMKNLRTFWVGLVTNNITREMDQEK
jgi:hypothetical protein